MKLGEPECLSPLDHHDRCVRDIDPHFDHRGRHENLYVAPLEAEHRGVFFGHGHLPVYEAHDLLTENRAQTLEPLLCRGQIQRFAFIHQRADPIALPPLGNGRTQPFDDLIHPSGADHRGLDRFSSRRLFIENGHIHVAILRERQRPRDRRCRHHQHVDPLAFLPQKKALPHAKSVLFVHDGQTQIGKDDVGLKHSMGPDQDLDVPLGKRLELAGPLRPLVATGQDFQDNARAFGERFQPIQMLPGQDFSRRHHYALPACLDGDQQRHERDQRLARTHIPLQQPVHPDRRGHVVGDVGYGPHLRARRAIGQLIKHLALQPARAPCFAPRRLSFTRTGQCKGELVGQKLVIGQPLSGGCLIRQVRLLLRAVRSLGGLGE